jgi:uncharacterized repeat protein (TIGR01451 family)
VGALVTGGSVFAAPSTDANVNDYAQCANDKPGSVGDPLDCVPQGWINGILNANNSQYREDQVTPQRVGLDLPNNGPLTDRTVTITYLARKGQGGAGNHAYDSLATWNYTETNAARCQGLLAADCPGGSASTFQIPSDPTVVADSNGAGSSTALHELPAADRMMTMYGGTITNVSVPVHDNAAGPGDDYATVTVTYSVASTPTKVQLLFGGHLAPSVGPRGWGANVGASFINGGPYHIRLDSVDSSSLGNRDNQIMSGAILPIGTATQTALHETSSLGVDVTPANNQDPATQTGITVTLPANGSGTYVTDYATVAPPGSTGTVAFRFYSSQAACNADTNFTGGTSAGSGKTLDVNSVAKSDPVHITSAGVTYWRAVFTGTGLSLSSDSGCSGEILTANQATTTATTLHETTSLGADVNPANNGDPISVSVGGYVTDYAAVTPASATGSVAFKWYSSLVNCTNDASGNAAGGGTLASGSAHSNTVQFNSAGTFYWKAFFTGTNNNLDSHSGCEQLVITPKQPSLTTNAGPNVTLGVNGTDLSDSSTLSGGTSDISGTITFHLYGPDPTPNSDTSDDCSNEVTGSPVTKSVDSGNGTYVSPTVHVSQAGTYHWIANYGGDSNNNATANLCNEANESVVVNKRDTSLTTDAGGPFRLGENGTVDLHDSATLSGSTSGAGGTITFTLYGPDPTPNSDSSDDCAEGNVVGTVSNNNVDGDGDYESPAISVNEPGVYHWVASYSGDDNNNGSESACGDEGENPLVIAPHISVVKSPDEQVIRSGNSVTWTIEVINDGSSTLTDVHVTDAQAPGCARTSADIPGLASMPPAPAEGSHVSYTCTRDNNTESFTNVAVATGTPEVGEDVSAEDSAHVTVIHPAISVSKTPHTQTVAFAGTVTFTIGVKNIGDSVLTDVHVTDAQAPGCARTKADIPQLASMAPGDELSYSCTVANVMANFTNVATAIGTPPVGPDVSATDSASVTVGLPPPPVTHPAISIVKNPKSQTVTTGGTATFTITVTNTGDVALSNVTVTDALSPNCNRTIGTLNPGQSVSYTCTRPNVQASFNNVAVATGTGGGQTVRAQDTAPVTAKAPFKPKPVPKIVSHKKPKATG